MVKTLNRQPCPGAGAQRRAGRRCGRDGQGEHSKPGAKYVWKYTLDYCGVENTLTAEGS